VTSDRGDASTQGGRATPGIIGPFRLVRSLGVGSTGEVYLAERIESFPQRVAIKVLPAGAQVASDALEADILVALDHPYIVKLIDRGRLPGPLRYLVMEYVDGTPIDVHCERHGCSTRQRVQLLIKVLGALAHAHRHLVIHADLKPPNILVTAEGEPKLLDFGAAQWRAHGRTEGWTPLFASPEQISGARLTAASDVYSVGVIARGLLPQAGRDLNSILTTAAETEAEHRYASVDAMRVDLQNYLDGRPLSGTRSTAWLGAVRWVRRHRLASSTGAAVALILIVAGVGVIRDASRAAHQRSAAQTQLHELISLTGTLEGDLYESVRTLPQSKEARRILVQGADATLATLAARDDKDAVLAVELARQYARLARLQLAEADADATGADGTRSARTAALRDLDNGMRLLQGIGRTDPRFARAQHDLAALAEFLDTARPH
jgi:serine/threonine protein kinase